jgi:hypothetical protein
METTKKQFEEAKQIADDYIRKVNKSLITGMVCICCKKKKVNPVEGMGLEDGSIRSTEQETGCWDDGTVEKISFGYGSRQNMRSFYVAVCDDCVDELEKDGLAVDLNQLRRKEKELGIQ